VIRKDRRTATGVRPARRHRRDARQSRSEACAECRPARRRSAAAARPHLSAFSQGPLADAFASSAVPSVAGSSARPCRPRVVWWTVACRSPASGGSGRRPLRPGWAGRGSSVRRGRRSARLLPVRNRGQVFSGHGEPMSIQTPHRDVFDGAAGAFQDEPVGDLGRCQTLWATGELKRKTVHLVLLTLDHERYADPVKMGEKIARHA